MSLAEGLCTRVCVWRTPRIQEAFGQLRPLQEQLNAARRESSGPVWSSAQPAAPRWTWHNPEGWARHFCPGLQRQDTRAQTVGGNTEHTSIYSDIRNYPYTHLFKQLCVCVCEDQPLPWICWAAIAISPTSFGKCRVSLKEEEEEKKTENNRQGYTQELSTDTAVSTFMGTLTNELFI